MQVLLNTDHHIEGRDALARHVEQTVRESLDRFGEHVTRVEAHLADVNAHKQGDDDIHCTMEARLAGFDPVVVKGSGPDVHQAISRTVGKLQRAVSAFLEKHDRKRGPSLAQAALDDQSPLG